MSPAHPVCTTCGVQQAPGTTRCAICEDERQYVGWGGQRWTTAQELRGGHRVRVEQEGSGVWGVGTEPPVAIGQRALLVQHPGGNVLWDCTSLVDDDAVAALDRLGGVAAIAVSHPHFYGAMVEWSGAFGGVPVHVHEADEAWLGRRDGNVVLWSGRSHDLAPGLTLLNAGVHFPGGTVLHRAAGVHGAGVLCTGDIFTVVMDRRWVSFMHSYPNYVPERPETVALALEVVAPYDFDRIYGAWWGRVVAGDGRAALRRSAERYWAQVGWAPPGT